MKDAIIIPDLSPSDLSRFYSKVKKTNNCWIWTSKKHVRGYGLFNIKGVSYRAHRIAFQLSGSVLDPRMVLDHLCKNTSCVNPEHLEEVTHAENTMRGISFTALNSKKTQCPKGHEYDRVDYRGRRCCSVCTKKIQREWQRNRRKLTITNT